MNAVPLWCKSNYSFLEGASHPAELVEEADRLGLRSLALTDRDGVYGMVKAFQRARDLRLHLIVGSQVTIEDGSHLVLLVQDKAGYSNLCRLVSQGRLRCEKGRSQVTWEEVAAHAEGLIALWGGEGSRILAMLPPDRQAEILRGAFGDRLYALLTRHLVAEDVERELLLRERAVRYGLPVVAGTEVLYHHVSRRRLQDVVTSIRHGATLSTAGRLLKPNAEHALLAPQRMKELFADDPLALARTGEIAKRCTFSMAELRYRYPSERLPDGRTSGGWLRELTERGARERFGDRITQKVKDQIALELDVIERLDYCGYFLTMYELVEFCKSQRILCQGRGSAANSVVCYCLGITAVDPTNMDLLFERFISIERAEPPDIDLDIEHERREEAIQHVYQKYGRTHAAMVAVVITYRSKSAARDVGKALGVPETELDRLSKLLGHFGDVTSEAMQQATLDPQDLTFRHMLDLVGELRGFPRHLSIHPGGFLLGHEPVADLVPIENGSMEDRTVIQWDKDDVETMGLFKVDLLGLGALTHTRKCFDLLRQHHKTDLSLATVPQDDKPTYDLLTAGDTVGVFQVESRAQMSMLPRLKPRNYYDLVIEISLVRPGPITGGMVHPYLANREKDPKDIEYPHPKLEPVLKRTNGVPLFQEQVMQLAVVAADYTPGEADQLRRDMASWRSHGRMGAHKVRLIENMIKNGIEPEFAERVFKQIEGFGEYGFPEAHAASFALISYVGAWLRCHHIDVFTCALLNSLPMGFYSAATIVEDARRKQVEIRALDVRVSQWDCTLEETQGQLLAVRMGLRLVRNFGEPDWEKVKAAAREGPFQSLEDFVWRTGLDEGALVALAEAGAFDGLGRNRRQALWEVRGLARGERVPLPVDVEDQPLFTTLSLFETINWDYRQAQHSAQGHLLVPMRPMLSAQGLPDARQVSQMRNGRRIHYVGVVICRQRPGTAKGVTFMTMEDETGFVNLVVWQKVFQDHNLLARTTSFLGVTGKLQIQHGVVHLVVEKFWRPNVTNAPTTIASRDFH